MLNLRLWGKNLSLRSRFNELLNATALLDILVKLIDIEIT